MTELATPYYLIDESRLKRNLEIIRQVRERSGAKSVLALKCFSTWCVFDLMRQYMDGTTSSSLYEARLGHEEFGGETHAYSVGFSRAEVLAVREFADKLIFNSVSQLRQFYPEVAGLNLGLRVNPGISYSRFDLADPARRYSRLGVRNKAEISEALPWIKGLMFHFNCENADIEHFRAALATIGREYGELLHRMEWVSLGGGLSFTQEGYPLETFCEALRTFGQSFDIQVYLEPGEAAVTQSTELVTTVLDVVHNEIDIAIVDASLEAHMLDHLIYRTNPRLASPPPGEHRMMIAGRTCLAGDVFGDFKLACPLQIGDEVRIADAGGYTMVQVNWFNGVSMPAIVVRRLDGQVECVRTFGYEDFKRSLS
ncbi:carboxynorspermidine decarboxylase [Thermochromatium tepidum]|jgi:carboxynorspermidine decarboxylase|uniref:Carboxynorspermidine/carboxyspermidine decarboxylase n=1 Tax=Thermochromatium tepidum ATCC 43061 TaxID=316276 RepID=A0A6I6DZ58_THETI|nr:carboxynorspermidine decarboxylase [Thermochromatium tepidum]QGU32961.1 carboxynorspermidine decarboxylase [Thermochromatium tepidum ATCC 43061]